MSHPDIDIHSSTWRAVAEAARAHIAEAQDQLELPGLDPVTTEKLRGEILAMRRILALPEPRRMPVVQTDTYGI